MAKVYTYAGSMPVVESTMSHAIRLADTMLPQNVKECFLHGYSPLNALIDRLDDDICLTILDGRRPVSMLGLIETSPRTASLWLLSSDLFYTKWFSVFRVSKKLIDMFHKKYYRIEVDALVENSKTIEWLLWLGFVPEGESELEGNDIVHFVRCNQSKNNIYNFPSRPVMH
jgi:hypothetical protein